MTANPFTKTPLYAAQVDPASGRVVRAFFFLGSVPRAVLEAARRARPRGADPRNVDWAAGDKATLHAFYGARWRELLTAEDPPPPEPLGLSAAMAPIFSGGARAKFGGEAAAELDFGDLGAIDEDEDEAPVGRARPRGEFDEAPARAAEEWAAVAAGPPVFSELAVYPEDTVYDLRLKLGLASGVPLYRQHLFYYVNEEGPALPYRFTVDGAPVVVDWRALHRAESGALMPRQSRAATPSSPGSGEAARRPIVEATVAGVAVDPRLEERREGIKVEALDTFTALGANPGTRLTRAYFVDLYAVLPPLGAAERPLDNLGAALRDRYQFDLLYYGGLLRYWPQLSPDACSLALSEPGRLPGVYPALDPDPAPLRARFAAERAVTEAALGWRPAAAKGGRSATAVTAATVRVLPEAARMRVAVRNVFDWLPTSPALAALVARFDVDSALLAEAGVGPAGPEARQGGPVPVLASKRHASSYGPRAAATVGWFVARLPRRDSVSLALARSPGAVGDEGRGPGGAGRQIPYAFLTIFADGRYEAAADWREDDRVGFEAVTREVAAVAAPVIAAVNAMGAAAFPIGGRLAPAGAAGQGARRGPAESAGVTLGAITVSAFWPHALTADAFRELKTRFRVYEKAGAVGIRGLQQAGAYTFSFRRGIVAYDPRLADRATAERGWRPAGSAGAEAEPPGAGAGSSAARPRGPSAVNQYAWLTDEAAALRWAATFPGRTVRIHHRATDLRVEVLGADSLAEFELIRRYVFAFLDGLLAGPARLRTGEAPAPRAAAPSPARRPADDEAPRAASRRLRRLQERDPNLFDLKKYDQAATVYSVLCQSGRQPHVYNEREAGALPAKKRAALVKYWNFTEEEPAFYECPSAKYPHLSFRAGQHPLGFCLPCCKKTRPAAGSRAALVNEGCLRDPRRAYASPAEGEADAAMSRHVLTYGKETPVGRLSDPPRELSEGLLLDAIPAPYSLQLVGVEQSAPAVPQAGFAYALAYAVGLGDATADEVLAELAELAGAMGDTFYALGGGAGAAFASAADLADAILGAFVRRDETLSPLGPGGAAADSWPAILAELARHAYGTETVVAADPEGSGAVTLEAAPEAAAAITGRGACPFGPAGAFVPPRIALLVSGPMGTYPAAALNPKFFLRVAPGNRWMAARRTFGFDAPPGAAGAAAALSASDEEEAQYVTDRVAEALRGALASGAAAGSAGLPDLALLARFACGGGAGGSANAGSRFAVETRLANMRSLCYGVVLRDKTQADGGFAYVPVRYSACPVDGTPTLYGVRPPLSLPKAALDAAVADLNAYIARAGEPYPPIAPAAFLVNAEGRGVGFAHVAAAGDESALYFYHDPADPPPTGSPTILFPYDTREVDAAIVGAARGRASPGGSESVAAATAALAQTANMRNRLYRLFLAEFSAALRGDRNEPLRRELAEAVRATRFDVPKSVAALRRRLGVLLRDYPADLQVVREAIARAYTAAPQDPAPAALAAIAATAFAFDRQTLGRLRALGSRREIAAALRALLAPRVAAEAGRGPPAELGNVYVSCGEAGEGAPQAQCAGGRLRVPEDRLDAFYDILAADVQNPSKAGLLSAVSAGVFDPLDFVRRPGEHLSVALGGP
jgi:hypothetical protein